MSEAAGSVPAGLQRALVETAAVREVTARAMTYLRAGFPVHLSGPAGTGKTTLALHLARLRGRPFVFLQGDDQLTSVDLVRGGLNVRRLRVVDNYIRSVVRTADDYSENWSDGWLAVSCKNGYTLVYDEFTRSRAEANNVLLSVLEEGVLVLPGVRGDASAVQVHPEFRAVLTSNPGEYVGVHQSPDALRDRLVTVHLDHFDPATELAIVRARSGLPEPDCRRVIDLVRTVRARVKKGGPQPSLRAAVALAEVLDAAGLPVDFSDPAVAAYCQDILGPPLMTADALTRILGAGASRAEDRGGPASD